VIITTKQAETINKVHIELLDSLALITNEANNLAYYNLKIKNNLYDLENKVGVYKYNINIKDKEIEKLKTKNKNHTLGMMLLLLGWTFYTGIQTHIIK
jgi:hypothetical protein